MKLKVHMNNEDRLNDEIKNRFLQLRDVTMATLGYADGIGDALDENIIYCVRTEIIIACCDLFNNLAEKFLEKEETIKEIENAIEQITQCGEKIAKWLTENEDEIEMYIENTTSE